MVIAMQRRESGGTTNVEAARSAVREREGTHERRCFASTAGDCAVTRVRSPIRCGTADRGGRRRPWRSLPSRAAVSTASRRPSRRARRRAPELTSRSAHVLVHFLGGGPVQVLLLAGRRHGDDLLLGHHLQQPEHGRPQLQRLLRRSQRQHGSDAGDAHVDRGRVQPTCIRCPLRCRRDARPTRPARSSPGSPRCQTTRRCASARAPAIGSRECSSSRTET